MVEHRRAPRRRAEGIIQVTNAITGDSAGRIGNLSIDGMMLVTERPGRDDALYQYSFQLPDERGRRAGFGGRFRAAREDDAPGAESFDLGRIVVPGPDLAIHADLADAPRDQLGVLGAEIQDENFVVVDVLHN